MKKIKNETWFNYNTVIRFYIGTHLYVSEEGNYEITKGGMHIKKFSVGETFGELAILYNTKRFASIQGISLIILSIMILTHTRSKILDPKHQHLLIIILK